jgi:hypothetical protein
MFIVTECEGGELRQEFHVHRSQQTHFTPGGVRIASNASAINMQPLPRQTLVCRHFSLSDKSGESTTN